MKKRLLFCILYILFLAVVICGISLFEHWSTAKYTAVDYTVQPGDTYDILAYRFDIDEDLCVWRERIKMYNGKKDSCLYTGEIIYILVEGDLECLAKN